MSLAEVEACLESCSGDVQAATVWLEVGTDLLATLFVARADALGGGDDHEEEDAYVLSLNKDQAVTGSLAQALQEATLSLLPPAVPRQVAVLPAKQLPRLPSGKLDRAMAVELGRQQIERHLGSSARASVSHSAAKRPRMEFSEARVAGVVRAALSGAGGAAVEAGQDIFLAGADSLTAAVIAHGLGTTPAVVLQNPSIRSLAHVLGAGTKRGLAADDHHIDSPGSTSRSIAPLLAPALGEPGLLHASWKAGLARCIDAPLLVHGRKAFACSHGGDVAGLCLDTGAALWKMQRPSCQFDCGLAVATSANAEAVVVVVAADGCVLFLDIDSGKGISPDGIWGSFSSKLILASRWAAQLACDSLHQKNLFAIRCTVWPHSTPFHDHVNPRRRLLVGGAPGGPGASEARHRPIWTSLGFHAWSRLGQHLSLAR